MISPLALHDADAEITAALALRATRNLHVHATGKRAERLVEAGFARAPHWIEIVAPAPIDLRARTRNARKAIERSLRAWDAAALSVELATASSFGVEPLVREIYYPIVVPYLDARGINPHGIHRVGNFVALAKKSVLAIVRAHDAIVGLALLKIVDLDGATRIAGAAAAGRGMEGLVYALQPAFAECRRGLMIALAQAVAETGGTFLSLGKDHPWCEPQYVTVLRRKLDLADAVFVHDGDVGHFYHWNLQPQEALWFAPWAGSTIEHRGLGAPDPVVADFIDRLRGAA